MTRAATLSTLAWRDDLASTVKGTLLADEPLARHTTLAIGGPAEAWFEPADTADLAGALSLVRRARVPYCVVGGGSNLLVGDRGVRGLVVHLGRDSSQVEETETDGGVRVVYPAGMPTSMVRRHARERGLIGPEFLIGIPGTLGGAIQMNAGTRLGEMVDVVAGAEVALPEGPRWLSAEDFGFAYRQATVPEGGVVTRIALNLKRATTEAAAAARDAAKNELKQRHATQPKGKSAGSIFKNPPGDHAGRLIEEVGLKGRRVGGAVVSEVHANFILNDGGATARDVLALIEVCRDTVALATGVFLELEVRLLGSF